MEDLSKLTVDIFSLLERRWLSHSHSDAKKTRVLSIDGGGTVAAVSGAALVRLEDQIQAQTGDSTARICDFFDIIAGTGIGAVLAVLIAADGGGGRPMFTARDALAFLNDRRAQMFKPLSAGIFRRRRRQRFSGEAMETVMRGSLRREDGTALTLRDTCKPILVPCFDLNSSAPFVFSHADASESPSFDFELWKICRATASDPTLFKPFLMASVDNKTACLAVDGGLVMNNPAAAAVTHVLHNKRDFPGVNGVEDLLVLSLGNGHLNASRDRRDGRRSGQFSASSVVDIALDGVSETVDQLMGNAFCWNRGAYVRIQGNGFGTGKAGDVLEEWGVESLPFGGKRLLPETNGVRIDAFVQRLVASTKTKKSSLPPSPSKDHRYASR